MRGRPRAHDGVLPRALPAQDRGGRLQAPVRSEERAAQVVTLARAAVTKPSGGPREIEELWPLAYGFRVDKSLALGYVAPEHAAVGTELDIEILRDRRAVRVNEESAYDPANTRLTAWSQRFAPGANGALCAAGAEQVSGSNPGFVGRRTVEAEHTGGTVEVDMARLRAYRYGRVQAELRKRDYGACVLFDPINVRYATDSRNMAVWTLHNAARYAFVPAEGKAVLFEFPRCAHLSQGLEAIGEVRPAMTWYYFAAGEHLAARAKRWAEEIADLLRERCGANRRLAVDHLNPEGARALEALGVTVFDGQQPLEQARCVKSTEEIAAMRVAIAVCEAGMARMHEALAPGITENELWSLLHGVNIARGGEWIETRLLSSGERTNPWFQESSERVINAGELVAFDTDLIGPYGYCADISRTYFCRPGTPSAEQRRLYRFAYDEIQHNVALLRPGLTFREYTEKSWRMPEEFVANRYSSSVHGVGLCDEYPSISYPQDWHRKGGYDGVIEANMTLCVESYIGAEGGAEGVKLEEQVLVTEDGPEVLSSFPFEAELRT